MAPGVARMARNLPVRRPRFALLQVAVEGPLLCERALLVRAGAEWMTGGGAARPGMGCDSQMLSLK